MRWAFHEVMKLRHMDCELWGELLVRHAPGMCAGALLTYLMLRFA